MTRTSEQSWSALLALAVALPLSLPACGGPSGGAKATAGKASAGKADGGKKAADDGKAGGDAKAAEDGKAGDPAAEAGDEPGGDELHMEPAETGKAADEAGAEAGAEDADDTGGAGGGTTAAAAAAEAGGDTGKAEAGEGGGESTGAAGPDKKALLAEVAKKRTKDDRATEALAEAEAAGATEKELARAAHKRGKALFATPDRAKVFFEWALEKDKKYPDPAFELAKQEVNTGELDAAKKHLAEVKKRKGKKLLGQIDYDPMWDVLKDDPEVRALIDG